MKPFLYGLFELAFLWAIVVCIANPEPSVHTISGGLAVFCFTGLAMLFIRDIVRAIRV